MCVCVNVCGCVSGSDFVYKYGYRVVLPLYVLYVPRATFCKWLKMKKIYLQSNTHRHKHTCTVNVCAWVCVCVCINSALK